MKVICITLVDWSRYCKIGLHEYVNIWKKKKKRVFLQ